MARELSTYHRDLAAGNRAAILDAATRLFLESGYDRTSLARVAQGAGVSRATLFKQFPTKAELFEATVLAAGQQPGEEPGQRPGERPGQRQIMAPLDLPDHDVRAGLVVLGRAYVELLTRPHMVSLMRTVIAESPRFPELRARTFDFGTLPVLATLDRYLRAQHAAGHAIVDDPATASSQYLGMIASAVFWPRLVHGTWSITEQEQLRVVDEAARTIVARYGARGDDARPEA